MKKMRIELGNIKSDESGYVSVESVFAMSFFLVVFILCLGFFTFVQPFTTLQREVHALSTLAQRQGGLTVDDISRFEDRISEYQFVDANKGGIEISAFTIPGDIDALGIDGLEDVGDNYVKRDTNEMIQLVVSVPSNNTLLAPVANFFGVGGILEKYTFKETFMSERY